jgi:hypothetical protein
MVVAGILGVVNEVTPVPPDIGEPPIGTENQSMVDPEGAVAINVNVPVPHLEKLLSDVGAIGRALTVAVTAVLVAEAQPVVVFLAPA